MALILLAAAVIALLVWFGRNPRALKQGQWRPALSAVALAVLVGAAALGVRGAWLPSAGLLLGGLLLAGAARVRGPTPKTIEQISEAEARSILGVGPESSDDDIRDAYARLIRRTHPDAGGSAGLAAQLNAARDRLLKR